MGTYIGHRITDALLDGFERDRARQRSYADEKARLAEEVRLRNLAALRAAGFSADDPIFRSREDDPR